MRRLLAAALYMPILKWKKGEYTALGTLPRFDQDCITPVVVVPPAGDFDPDVGRPLEPAEHIKSFGNRLFAHWRQRPIFIDALHIDDERHRVAAGVHPLKALLSRAQLFGAQASPVTSLRRSAGYQDVVRRFCVRNPAAPVCLRITAGDLEADDLKEELSIVLRGIACLVERVVLVIDFGGNELSQGEEFLDLIISKINQLPYHHDWLQLSIALTSFPEKIKVAAGERTYYQRVDWEVYKRLMLCGNQLLRRPVFGDYALEYPKYEVIGRVTPRARLRYSTETHYLADSGTSVKKPNGYAAIFPVADALVKSDEFAGRDFSKGDAFIYDLSARARTSGTAWQWRWATTEHHLRLVLKGLRELLSIEVEEVAEDSGEREQFDLF